MNTKPDAGRSGPVYDLTLRGLELTVAVLLSFLPEHFKMPITFAEQTLLALATFLAFAIIEVLWRIAKYESYQVGLFNLWELQKGADEKLETIRYYYLNLLKESHGANDLFVSYFNNDINALCNKIRETAERKELRVNADYILNVEGVFDAFLGDDEPILKYTWEISGAERLFDEPTWARFFETTLEMLDTGRIKGIKTVLILEGDDLVGSEKIRKLHAFFVAKGPKLACRYLTKEQYVKICADNHIGANYIDFGVYSRRMLFRSEAFKPIYTGVYTKDSAEIERYDRFFDQMWNSEFLTQANPVKEVEADAGSLAKLFEGER